MRSRILVLPWILLLAAAVPATAGDKPLYENKDLQIRLQLPSDIYELKAYEPASKGEWWDWEETICEIRSKEDAGGVLCGLLLYSTETWTIDTAAKWREDTWAEVAKDLKKVREEKLDRKVGKWLRVEFTMNTSDTDWHYTHLFIEKDKKNFELVLWCPAASWEATKGVVEEILKSVRYGDLSGGDDKGEDPGEGPETEVKGQKYINRKLSLHVTAPAGWTLKTEEFQLGLEDTLVEFQSGETLLGALALSDKGGIDPKTYADAIADQLKEAGEEFKDLGSSKTAKGWVRRDVSFKQGENTVHVVVVSLLDEAKRTGLFLLIVHEGSWEASKAAVDSLLGSLTFFQKKAPAKDPKDSAAGAGGGGGGGKNPWAAYGEGTWVETEIESTVMGNTSKTVMKRTLVKKDDKELTLKIESKMVSPTEMNMPASEMKEPVEFPAGGTAGGAGAPSGAKELGQGEEEVEVAGKKLKCKWVELEMTSGDTKTVVKSWTCDEVPGGMVKSTTKSTGGPTGDVVSNLKVIGFEKK
jgi:hypothetical protein